MDYVVGQNLAGLLRQQRAAKAQGAPPVLSFTDITALASQICAGVQVAHEQGIVYRDIGPANIMVTPRGTVKVADFGPALEIIPRKDDAHTPGEYEFMGLLLDPVRQIMGITIKALFRQPAGGEADHGGIHESFVVAGLALVVAHEAARFHEPAKGALHHPAPWEQFKTFGVVAAF